MTATHTKEWQYLTILLKDRLAPPEYALVEAYLQKHNATSRVPEETQAALMKALNQNEQDAVMIRELYTALLVHEAAARLKNG